MNSREAEQQELERAIELLGRNTRPGRLLEFLGAKYLQEQEGQLTEFNIATAVFGRSAKSFDPTEDAVVRVEAHRLRKKLKEIYEKDGRTQGVQISLPAGTYVPNFTALRGTRRPPRQNPTSPANRLAYVACRFGCWSLVIIAVVTLVIASALMNGRSRSGADLPRSNRRPRSPARPRGRNPRRDHRAALHVGLQWQRSHRQLRCALDTRSLLRGRRAMVERQRFCSRYEPPVLVCELENRRIRIRHPDGTRQL